MVLDSPPDLAGSEMLRNSSFCLIKFPRIPSGLASSSQFFKSLDKNCRNSQKSSKPSDRPNAWPPKNRFPGLEKWERIILGGMDEFEVADWVAFWVSHRSQLCASEWTFQAPWSQHQPLTAESAPIQKKRGHIITIMKIVDFDGFFNENKNSRFWTITQTWPAPKCFEFLHFA